MPTACILSPGAKIHLFSQRLEVRGEGEDGSATVLRELPIRDLDRLIMAENVQISSAAMAELMRSHIPISILGWNGQYLGGFLPAQNDHGQSRLAQYRHGLDAEFIREMSGRIITAKLYNQRRILQRLLQRAQSEAPLPKIPEDDLAAETSADQAELPDQEKDHIRSTLASLEGIMTTLSRSGTVDEIRGYEGAATARYFQAWARFLPSGYPFERRSTRPPHNPVNACISFGSTLLYHEVVAAIHAHGLDPAIGLLHTTENGRWSLALDLVEPFRPALVEALTLDLFSHRMLNQSHFEPKNGGIYLNDAGRRKFILQYERRMERQFMSESVGHRTTLRHQLEHQVVMLKSSFEDKAAFEPFLVN